MNIGLHDFSITLYNLGTIAGLIKDFKTVIYRQLILHQIVYILRKVQFTIKDFHRTK